MATTIGIPMSGHPCTQQQGVDPLRSSQTTNRTLRDIAHDLLHQTDISRRRRIVLSVA